MPDEYDPCGGRDCDTCEIGGCDHGMQIEKSEQTTKEDDMNGFQPRYIAYAKAHGKTPEQMSAEEKNNSNFIFWINEKWRQFDRLHPELYGRHEADWVHVQFDDMLNRGVI